MSFIKKYKFLILLFIGVIVLGVFNFDVLFFDDDDTEYSEYSSILITSEYNEPEYQHIIVDIKGEVNYPGYYEIPSYLRVGDIINVAGGLTNNAFIDDINLAEKIYDEMIIVIPSITSKTDLEYDEEIVKVVVEIKGEVNYPGVYEVYYNSRVSNLISVAGGLTSEAFIDDINLASKVYDEMVITIPKKPIIIEETEDEEKVVVEIKGEVLSPGIYELPLKSRINDLINLAGGITVLADMSEINLVDILEDCDVIEIPKLYSSLTDNLDPIIVEIKGEIKNPGIYYIQDGLRIYHIISQAGGVLESADLDEVDQAMFLEDGMTIYIPKKEVPITEIERYILVEIYGEVIHPGTYSILETSTLLDLIYLAGGVTTDCDLSKIDFETVLCLGASIYLPAYNEVVEQSEDDNLININKANLETLMTLPGIGQILGQRIIDYRAEFGDYLTIEDVMNVSGIKESIYEEIKDFITV